MYDNNNNKNNNGSDNQENISHVLSDQIHTHQNIINGVDGYLGDGGPGSALPWAFHQPFSPAQFSTRAPDPFLVPPPPGDLFFNQRRPFGYEPGSASDHHMRRLLTESLGHVVRPIGSAPFGLHAELERMTAQEIMDAKALAASKSHSEAERRRRERINNHLAKLRSLLPSTTKTDKASLLAEVIQHVKELKRQTSLVAETSPVPTETDELTIDNTSDEDGRPIIKASMCCDDRSDLMPDLIKTLKDLSLKTLRAEITTLGGRVKNVLFITGDDDETNGSCEGDVDRQHLRFRVSAIEEALRAVMERSNGDDQLGCGTSVKRQRTNANNA